MIGFWIETNKGLETIFSKMLLQYFLDEVTEDSIEEENRIMQDIDIKNEIYECPHCDIMFSTIAEVEGHIIIKHEDITRQIVKCSECKKVLPNDEMAIKHHMINEHIKAKQQLIPIGGVPKKMKDEKIDEIEMKKLKSNLIRRGPKKITEIVMPKQKYIVPKSEPIMNIETNPELASYRTIDPDIKRYACTYCGDRFQMRADRAAHEKENHVDKDGNLLEITCDLCQEKLATSIHYRRHCIDKHKKHNKTLVKKEQTFCCDECGKTFKVS